jgi:predicted MPP superfamily phosphohydrolase
MLPSEWIAVLLFLGMVSIVYIVAAWLIVESILRRLRGQNGPASHRMVWFRRAVLGLAVVGLGCMAYGYFLEPYWPEITHVPITSPKLRGASRPIRIVHISDLHSDPKPRLEERLPALIADQKPDLIAFTGDAINSPAALPILRRCLTRLSELAPTFVVKGNFDALTWQGVEPFAGTGTRELDGQVDALAVAGVVINIAGVALAHEDKLRPTLASLPPDKFNLFLFHTPDQIENVVEYNVDLYCAGHTHGGQVALPIYGALVVLSGYGKRFERGLHRVGHTWLYVNRGIGMEGFSAPRVRFWARPEITVYVLTAPP